MEDNINYTVIFYSILFSKYDPQNEYAVKYNSIINIIFHTVLSFSVSILLFGNICPNIQTPIPVSINVASPYNKTFSILHTPQ